MSYDWTGGRRRRITVAKYGAALALATLLAVLAASIAV
ncbi:UNVERIFIED_ORG: hypothetical protein J2W85_005789 [Ensifer adhaerens]|jgi:hypothetical protein|nr:hypothetical protein [Ensifer adhaerens]